MTHNMKKREFIDLAPEHGSIRVNHLTDYCSGTSKSMRIWRDEHDNVRAYCHRCGKSGLVYNPHFVGRKDTGRTAVPDDSVRSAQRSAQWDRGPAQGNERRLACYAKADRDWSRWGEARQWLMSYGISEQEVIDNELRFDQHYGELYIPLRHLGDDTGLVTRGFGPEVPRYHHQLFVGGMPHHLALSGKGVQRVVLVEDVISAIKVSRYHDAVALLGVIARARTLAYLVSAYREFVIFLDNDNSQVIKARRVLRNTLAQVGEVKVVTNALGDPKACSNEFLEAL